MPGGLPLVAVLARGGHAVVVKSVLVTGASTGIGEACALRLDRLGHRVYAGVRSEEHARGLRQRGSERIVPVFLDVTDQAQVDAVAKQIGDGGGSLDGVVNNAGVARGGPLEYLPLEIWREQLEVNVLGQGISVSVVEPGAIRTPIWDKGRQQADRLERALPEEARTRYARHIAAVRKAIEMQDRQGANPDKVAAAVERALFSSRPKTRYLVGTDARVQALLVRWLPDRPREAIVRRFAGP